MSGSWEGHLVVEEVALDGDGYLHQRDGDAALTRCWMPWVELELVRRFMVRTPLCCGCWDREELLRQGVVLRTEPRPTTSWPGGAR